MSIIGNKIILDKTPEKDYPNGLRIFFDSSATTDIKKGQTEYIIPDHVDPKRFYYHVEFEDNKHLCLDGTENTLQTKTLPVKDS